MSRKNGKLVDCTECGKKIYKPLARLKRNKNNYCSHRCASINKRKDKIIVKCHACGKEMSRVPCRAFRSKKFTFCNRKCMASGLTGVNISGFFKKGNTREKCINFKGGTQVTNGYISVLAADHPFANKRGYIYQHRLIMEEMIGRYLKPEEVVHHIDEDKQNNSPENLMLFPTDTDHARYHGFLRRRKNRKYSNL